jgi:hypothetical protein
MRSFAVPIAPALILASSATPYPVLATGLVLVVLVAANVVASRHRPVHVLAEQT